MAWLPCGLAARSRPGPRPCPYTDAGVPPRAEAGAAPPSAVCETTLPAWRAGGDAGCCSGGDSGRIAVDSRLVVGCGTCCAAGSFSPAPGAWPSAGGGSDDSSCSPAQAGSVTCVAIVVDTGCLTGCKP